MLALCTGLCLGVIRISLVAHLRDQNTRRRPAREVENGEFANSRLLRATSRHMHLCLREEERRQCTVQVRGQFPDKDLHHHHRQPTKKKEAATPLCFALRCLGVELSRPTSHGRVTERRRPPRCGGRWRNAENAATGRKSKRRARSPRRDPLRTAPRQELKKAHSTQTDQMHIARLGRAFSLCPALFLAYHALMKSRGRRPSESHTRTSSAVTTRTLTDSRAAAGRPLHSLHSRA